MFDIELRRQKAFFVALDAIVIAGAAMLAALLNDRRHAVPCMFCPANRVHTVMAAGLLAFCWVVAARAARLYEPGRRRTEDLIAISSASCATTLALLAVSFLDHSQLPRLTVGSGLMLAMLSVPASRYLLRRLLEAVYAHPAVTIPMVIVGLNPVARYVSEQIREIARHYEFLGFIYERAPRDETATRPVLGGTDRIAELAARHRNLEAAIILPDASVEESERIIRICEHHHVRWRVMPPMLRSLASGLTVDMAGVVPLIGPRSSNITGLNFILKRGFDLVAGLFALAITAPVIALAAFAIRIFDGAPVLLRQTRVGIHGKPFDLFKFRTMRASASDDMHRAYVQQWIGSSPPAKTDGGQPDLFKLANDPRITRIGKWLRRFSIDELPQIFNVLRGQMSLVGPRPALPYELELYEDWHRRRLGALPGITGLWQVSGRNRLSFEQMVKLDIKYIEEWSLEEDLRILARTVPALLNGGGH